MSMTSNRFPLDTDRRDLWLKSLGLQNANKWHYVCSQHFHASDYNVNRSGKRTLKPTAVPTLSVLENLSRLV